MLVRTAAIALVGFSVGCGPHGGGQFEQGLDAGPLGPVESIEVTPADKRIVVVNGKQSPVQYRAIATLADGSTADVTARVQWSTQDAALLEIDAAASAVPSDTRGGETKVVAYLGGGQSGFTGATVVQRVVRTAGIGRETSTMFDNALPDPALTPVLIYPASGTLIPPNFPGLEFHFVPAPSTDAFELNLVSAFYEYVHYTTCSPLPGGCVITPPPEDWNLFGPRFAGTQTQVSIAGLSNANPATKGVSTRNSLSFTVENLTAGLYYWAATGSGKIYRFDFGRSRPPELFYPNNGTCVGCHALSRDGKIAAVGIDAPAPSGLDLLDVTTRGALWQDALTEGSNYRTFSPDGARLLTTDGFTLQIRDTQTGAVLGATEGQGVLFPDWSADGSKLVYTRRTPSCTQSPCTDYVCEDGAILIRSVDGDVLGPEVSLVPATTGNNYYPAFTPSGEWIVFNRAPLGNGDSYSNPLAELWTVSAAGGEPVRLTQAEGGTTGNSWPKTSPIALTGPNGPVIFLTFSSKRAVGLRPVSDTTSPRASLWMAAIDPSLAGGGTDPSFPAVFLPWQTSGTGNYIAQWAIEIPHPCGPDGECPTGEFCEGGTCVVVVE